MWNLPTWDGSVLLAHFTCDFMWNSRLFCPGCKTFQSQYFFIDYHSSQILIGSKWLVRKSASVFRQMSLILLINLDPSMGVYFLWSQLLSFAAALEYGYHDNSQFKVCLRWKYFTVSSKLDFNGGLTWCADLKCRLYSEIYCRLYAFNGFISHYLDSVSEHIPI